MIVSVVSVMTISLFERHSIYAMRLAREGKLLTHHTDKSVLTLMNMESVVEHDYTAVEPELPLGQLVMKVANASTEFIPVIDKGGALLGVIDINKTRHVLFRTELYQRLSVAQIMTPAATTVGKNDPMEDVMKKFDTYNVNYIPVVDVNNVLLGYISRSHVYTLYRKIVADYSAE